jgi:hypothetical protein
LAAPITGHPHLAPDQAEEAVGGLGAAAGRCLAAGEGLQVHAGAEGAVAGPGEDDRPDLGVRIGVVHRPADAAYQRGVERVAGLGPVQPGDEDVAAPLAHQHIRHEA